MRKSLIIATCAFSTICSFGQVKDSLIAYSLITYNSGSGESTYWYEKQSAFCIDTVSNIFKVKYFRSNEFDTLSPLTFFDKKFPQNISFRIDTNRIELFYDSAVINKYLLFDFNVQEGDTEEVYTFSNNSTWLGYKKVYGEKYQKIIIDSIRLQNFDFVGNKIVYYFHSDIRGGGGFWIKGLTNGYGGFLNLAGEMSTWAFTTCVQKGYDIIKVYYEVNCNKFLTSVSSLNNLSAYTFKVYPNPSQNKITLQYELKQSKHLFLKIYNSTGSLITQQELINSTNTFEINTINWSTGLYFFNFEADGKTVAAEKVVVTK